MSDEVRYVRLRPFDERSGHVCRTYTHRYAGQFLKFSEPGVWNRVPKALADELEKARQVPTVLSSPPVFDVCDEDGARQLDLQAKMEREKKKAKVEPTVDTAKDLVESEGVGRGDLSLEDVSAARLDALSQVAARASGEDKAVDETPEETPDPPVKAKSRKKTEDSSKPAPAKRKSRKKK